MSEFPSIKNILEMTPEERNKCEWRIVASVLKDAQKTMEKGCPPGKYTWIDAALSMALARGRREIK